MLKELFESCFYKTFPTKKNVIVNLTERSYSGTFSLLDAEACRDCRLQCDPIPSNRKQLMVLTAKNVNTIKVDSIFKPVKEDYGRMCDYLMDDGNKFALIEMTGGRRDLPEGKNFGQIFTEVKTIAREKTQKWELAWKPVYEEFIKHFTEEVSKMQGGARA